MRSRPVPPFTFMLGKYIPRVKMNLVLHKGIITASWKRWGYPSVLCNALCLFVQVPLRILGFRLNYEFP